MDIEMTDDAVISTYKIPLMKGFATISLIYDRASDEVTFEGVRRGLPIETWKKFWSQAEDELFPVDSIDQKYVRPTFKWKITDEDDLGTALNGLKTVCKLEPPPPNTVSYLWSVVERAFNNFLG
jgi:hypothetical protein